MSKIIYTAEGIEIDHGDRDISAAAARNGVIEVGIGEDFTGRHRPDKPQGYAHWADINLTIDEARAFCDWLTSKVGS